MTTATKSKYADLIARLEAATEDSRELWWEVNKTALADGWIDQARAEHNAGLIHVAFKSGYHDVLIAVALTLVPDGWTWDVGTNKDPGTMYSCIIRGPRDTIDPEGQCEVGFSNHPALAICIAALRAAEAMEGGT